MAQPRPESYKSGVLVTGGTNGLGYQCATEIARQQPEVSVIIASRTSSDDAASRINATLGQSNVRYLPLDLADLDSVRDFAQHIQSKQYPPFSALVLNAGLQYYGEVQLTPAGLEKTFGVNHVGHALLFYLLMSHLTADCRIVLTTSSTHDPTIKSGVAEPKYVGAEELAHPSERTKSNLGIQRYTTSKLCNVLWTYALDRHIKSTSATAASKQWTVTTMDPGLMYGTSLTREASFVNNFKFTWINWLFSPIYRMSSDVIRSPAISGADLARLAVGPEMKGVTAKYFSGRQELKSSADSYDVEKQEDLWTWTAKYLAKDAQEEKKFMELS